MGRARALADDAASNGASDTADTSGDTLHGISYTFRPRALSSYLPEVHSIL